MQPDLDAWDAWSPAHMRDRMAAVDVPWGVAGGWALDLFRGEQTRPHDDLEIAIPAARFPDVARHFVDCDFAIPENGLLHPVSEGTLTREHQTWARERASGKWRFDVFREPHDGDTWICRRDPAIRWAYKQVFERTADGVPFVRPEIVLLFKAKHVRDKDRADWAGTLPHLDRERLDWLAEALQQVHPGHSWLADLDQARAARHG